jgi:two-component system, cell cycle sensor histidine kinase and response regulator CckA
VASPKAFLTLFPPIRYTDYDFIPPPAKEPAAASGFFMKAGIKNSPSLSAEMKTLREKIRALEDSENKRREAEEALRKSEEQIRQWQRVEAIGRLAGGVAHDFNNLLMTILGCSELLLRDFEPGDRRREEVEEIRRAAQRATSLTHQLLAFGRRQVLQPRVLDLNEIVENMNRMLRRMIGEDIQFQAVLEPRLWPVKVDPGQIEQVIMNLVVNARDAMPDGGRLTLETANLSLDEEYARRHISVQPGPYVMMAVTDTGCGMDAETRAHLFEPFFTTKEKGKGTGLGLSTVYGIIKQSGGNIWAYSEVGKGSTFKVYLPKAEESAQSYKPREKETAPSPPRGRETILLVEDEEAVRTMISRVLTGNGYRVLEASQGNEALEICRRHPGSVHLMVTDVIMPQMSGRELAERLSRVRPEMKVLFMSGYPDNAIVHHGVLDPGTAFLQKPFSLTALENKVREILGAAGEPKK